MGVRGFFGHAIFSALALQLCCLGALAHDWDEDEGRFFNLSNRVLYCFKDVGTDDEGHLCVSALPPGRSCRADAVGTSANGGRMFKIPNQTSYGCRSMGADDLECRSADAFSTTRTVLASIHNGPSSYGNMNWQQFNGLMKRDQFEGCDPHWETIAHFEQGDCVASLQNFSDVLRAAAFAIEPLGRTATAMRR